MKFCDKLARQRKNNNLSQEQLADRLGVSRQAVSKWESGQSYPDMEKIIQLCKILNCSLDELIDDDATGNKEMKNNNKINFNSYFKSFLDFVTKTYNMICSMGFWQVIKCLFEMGIITLLLLLLGSIILNILDDSVLKLIGGIPFIGEFFSNLLYSILIILLMVIGIIILIHLFKIRYLDYFVTIEDNEVKEKVIEKELPEERIMDNKRVIVEKPKEKIIIRDPKHTSYSFFNGLSKIITFCLKIFLFMIGIFFIFSFIFFMFGFTYSIFLLKYGTFFLGILLALIGCLAINCIVLKIIYNIIVNLKSNFKLLFIIFLIGLTFFGVGSGIGFNSFTQMDVPNSENYDKEFSSVLAETIPMSDNLSIYSDNIEYIIDNNINDINVEIFSKDITKFNIYESLTDTGERYYIYPDNRYSFDTFYLILSNMKEKKLPDFDNLYKVVITSNENNINNIKSNY